jgi:hypothetical protein
MYLLLLGLATSGWAQTPVFQSGTGGYTSFRIRAIVKTLINVKCIIYDDLNGFLNSKD